MALTALHGPDDQVVDLTLPDPGNGAPVDNRASSEAHDGARCRACRSPLRESVTARGYRHFVHTTSAVCPLGEDSAEYLELVAEIARHSRAAGWRTDPEHPGSDWRADVLSTAADGRRIAWMIQLSPQTTDHALDRTRRCQRDDIECVWIAVGDHDAAWHRPVGALVTTPVHPDTGVRGWTVVSGCRKHHLTATDGAEHGVWADVEQPIELQRITREILRGRLVPYPQHRYGARPWWWVRADERAHAHRIGTDVETVLAERTRSARTRP